LRLRRSAAIVVRQWYVLRGSPARVLPLFAWVAVDVVLWGFITRYLDALAHATVAFVPALLGAVLLWDFFIRVMQGVTMGFFEDVWSRNFLNLFATPLSTGEYVAGLVFASIATSVVGLAVMAALATAAFGLSFATYGALLAPALLVLFLTGIALGVVGCSIVLRFGPASEWLVWPIPAALSPFAGVFYPVGTLPAWMRAVSRILPPSYVFEALRDVVAGRAPRYGLVLAGGALATLEIVLACWVFAAVFRKAVRSGLVARYSAETVT
jgi:ABC-2 type transport system permease protein